MTAPIHQHFRLFKPLLIAYQFCLVQPVQLIAIFTKSLFAQKHWPKNKSAIIQFTVKGHSINESFVVTDGNDAVVKRSDNFNATLDQLLLRTQIIYDLSYTRGLFWGDKEHVDPFRHGRSVLSLQSVLRYLPVPAPFGHRHYWLLSGNCTQSA